MTATLHAPWSPDTRYLHTGGLIVDLCYRQIVHPAGTELPQRLFDLLLLLMAEPHTLHTRAELFERLWPGLVVEDANLTQSVWLLRRALGEERKSWIRTIAKGGYVFEPPGPIEALTELPVSSHASEGGSEAAVAQPSSASETFLPTHSIEPVFEPASSTRTKRWWLGVAAALVGVALTGAVGIRMTLNQNAPAPVVTHAPLTVALVTVKDPGSSAQWPAKLLHEWVKWKLGSLPEVSLLSEADLAAGAGSVPAKIVFLASGEAPNDPGKILIRARFQEAGREQRVEQEGDPSDVPAMVDAMSKEILRHLAPSRADQPWPKLELNAGAAQQYALAAEAFDSRNWMAAAALQNEVVKLAPRFGLARTQLAFAQARLAQAASAAQQMDIAIDDLQPVPADVGELLRAQRLALDPTRKVEAADAYGKLVARYPDKAAFVLQYASMLVRNDRPNEALPLLLKLSKEEAPLGVRIARLITLAEIYQTLGDPERMRQAARAAERLARSAGEGWELEIGGALLLAASADSIQYGARADTKLYEEAAQQLERAGNATGALYARFLAETRGPQVPGSEQKLSKLLALANAGGYRDIEINALYILALRSQMVGDLKQFRLRMEEAASIALVTGDVGHRMRVDGAMMFDDLLRARLTSAEARMQRIRAAKTQGMLAVLADHLEADLSAVRGYAKGAIEGLQNAERALSPVTPGESVSAAHARLACSIAEYRVPLGDLAGARQDTKRCATATDAVSQMRLLLVRASIERLAGDRDAALANVRRAQSQLQDFPAGFHRWMFSHEIARQLTRLGEPDASDALLRPLPAEVDPSGYTLISSLIETGLAENAAVRGDWPSSQRHATSARAGIPKDLWLVMGRLDFLDIAAALASGNRSRAIALAKQVHAQAHHLGDAEMQLQLHSLMPHDLPDGNSEEHRLQMARTGMRGASIAWLQTR